MKKFSKSLLTIVLACAMVFGLSGMTAFAAEAEEPGISTFADEEGYISFVIKTGDKSDECQLSYSEINEYMYYETIMTSDGEPVDAYYVLITDLLEKCLNINPSQYEKITASTSECDVTVPGEIYTRLEDFYLCYDETCYRLASSDLELKDWYENVSKIEVIMHDWGEPEWYWDETDYSSAHAERACQNDNCSAIESTNTATIDNGGIIVQTAPPTATKPGESVYTATATFASDGTTVTDTKTEELPATEDGSIAIQIDGVDSDPLTYHEINEAIDAADEDTFTYGSNSVTAKFALISDMLAIDYDFCSYTVTDSDGNVTAGLPTDTYLYLRDDTWVYRTAVNGGTGSQWRNDPTLINVITEHTWGEDVTWTWNDDYTEATATRTCSVCKATDSVTTEDITHTTTATATKAGETTYTATATFDDATEPVTGTVTVDTPAIDPTGSITFQHGDDTWTISNADLDAAIAAADTQTFTYGNNNSVEAQFVLISDLTKIEDFCGYTVTAGDGFVSRGLLPTDTYLYWRTDKACYRTAVNDGAGNQWIDDPVTIEVKDHDWSDAQWTWSDPTEPSSTDHLPNYTATATRTCSVCNAEQTADAEVTKDTTATATEDGVTTYTATATFEGETEPVTDTKKVDTDAIDPTGSITFQYGEDTWTISNADLDAAIAAADPQTFTYTSRGNENTLESKFVLISDLTKIEDFCSYTVTSSDDYVTSKLPTDTYLYWRTDKACYRTAVNGGTGSQWADDPVTIEVIPHDWGDVTWTWADDYSSAEASMTCSVCDTTETAEAVITTETTEPTEEAAGETVYTATATFKDGTEKTDTKTVTIAPIGTEEAKEILQDVIGIATDPDTLDESNYTPESWQMLQDEIAKAQDVMEDDTKTAAEINAETVALVEAIAKLEPAAKPAEVDKSVLNSMIKAAEALNDYKDSYTPESWQNMQDALKDAQDVADNDEATQDEVNEAASDLVNALVDLVPEQQPAEPDKNVLDAAVKAAEALEDYKDYYTEDSWNDLQDALKAAQDVADNDEATQDEINEAASDLVAALADLQPVSESGTGGETKDGLNRIVAGQLWGYYKDGKVDTSYTGFAENKNGKWYVVNGYVNFAQNSVYKDTNGVIGTAGTWYYVVGNKVQSDFTGLAHYKNANGWWYISSGEVDFTHNGVDKNQNGWWYVKNGKVDFGHNGVDKNQYGWWYITGGKVQFGFTGLANYKNQYGWWYIKNGKVDFTYTGRASNKNGTWNVVNGKVQF